MEEALRDSRKTRKFFIKEIGENRTDKISNEKERTQKLNKLDGLPITNVVAEIWYHVYFQLSQHSFEVQSWHGIEYMPSKIHVIEAFLPYSFSWKLQQTP